MKLNGQPILSIADMQWVLNEADPAGADITAEVRRGNETAELRLHLTDGWRHRDDIDWRVSSWGLRRMVTGGLKLAAVPDERRRDLQIADGKMALLVEHLGQYGKHAAAKRAGFRKDDILVSFDGRSDLQTSSELLAYGATATRPGTEVPVELLRDGKRMTLQLPMQD